MTQKAKLHLESFRFQRWQIRYALSYLRSCNGDRSCFQILGRAKLVAELVGYQCAQMINGVFRNNEFAGCVGTKRIMK